MVNEQPRGRESNRSLALNELEADIDLLIFKVMGVGDLTQIETALRVCSIIPTRFAGDVF